MKTKLITNREDLIQKFEYFCKKHLRNYASKRNFDLGPPHKNVSNLSPYIKRRFVDENEILKISTKYFNIQKIEKFVQEIFWRTYWKGWLESHPWIFRDYENEKKYPEIPKRTGIKCFDHWTEELVETGYLHNHARMWYASIWIFTLNKPWKLGANFFKKHLLDWCPASNTLGWRWVAGLQTVGKYYLARAENINFYTNKRFNPKNQLNENIQTIASESFDEKVLNPVPDKFLEIKNFYNPGVVLTNNDLTINNVFAEKKIDFKSCIFTDSNNENFKSELVLNFEKKLTENIFNTINDIKLISNLNELISWAKREKIKNLIIPYETVGNNILNKKSFLYKLNEENINYNFYIRDWDRLAYPYATKGFFNFKKKIPDLLKLNEIVDIDKGL